MVDYCKRMLRPLKFENQMNKQTLQMSEISDALIEDNGICLWSKEFGDLLKSFQSKTSLSLPQAQVQDETGNPNLALSRKLDTLEKKLKLSKEETVRLQKQVEDLLDERNKGEILDLREVDLDKREAYLKNRIEEAERIREKLIKIYSEGNKNSLEEEIFNLRKLQEEVFEREKVVKEKELELTKEKRNIEEVKKVYREEVKKTRETKKDIVKLVREVRERKISLKKENILLKEELKKVISRNKKLYEKCEQYVINKKDIKNKIEEERNKNKKLRERLEEEKKKSIQLNEQLKQSKEKWKRAEANLEEIKRAQEKEKKQERNKFQEVIEECLTKQQKLKTAIKKKKTSKKDLPKQSPNNIKKSNEETENIKNLYESIKKRIERFLSIQKEDFPGLKEFLVVSEGLLSENNFDQLKEEVEQVEILFETYVKEALNKYEAQDHSLPREESLREPSYDIVPRQRDLEISEYNINNSIEEYDKILRERNNLYNENNIQLKKLSLDLALAETLEEKQVLYDKISLLKQNQKQTL
eukprot:snap_masked-scaffold_93-processed-gene-0.29-mRNA-1 protein AED:1.00 eAED:1.00 QI:0/-1/0/0/-1/1/1/0/528